MIKFECNTISLLINEILQNYKEEYIKRVKDKRKEQLDIEKPVYFACALFLGSRITNMKIDRKKLITEIGIVESEFNTVFSQMLEYCDELIKAKSVKKGKKNVKKPNNEEKGKKVEKKDEKKDEKKIEKDKKIEKEVMEFLGIETEKVIEKPIEETKEKEIDKPIEETKKRKIDEIIPKEPKKKRQVTLDFFIHKED